MSVVLSAAMKLLNKRVPNSEEHENDEVIAADESIRELPQDAIYEILTWVPLHEFNRTCRWVCKDWNGLVYEWDFRKLQLQRTQTISGYFLQTRTTYQNNFISIINHSPPIPSPTLDFLPASHHQLSIVASSGSGLLCCRNFRPRIPCYYVCKPTTREWKQIPNPRTRFWEKETAMVVKNSNPLRYKIVRFSERKLVRSGYHCEVFDSHIGLWKRKEDIEFPGNSAFLDKGPGLLINNTTFHWLLWSEIEQIFTFNIDTESPGTISLPEEIVNKKNGDMKLEEYRGKLGLIYFEDEFMEIWVMEELNVWEEKKRVNLENFRDLAATRHSVPLSLYNTESMLMLGTLKVVWFDFESSGVDSVKICPLGYNLDDVFPFESDLIPCKLGS